VVGWRFLLTIHWTTRRANRDNFGRRVPSSTVYVDVFVDLMDLVDFADSREELAIRSFEAQMAEAEV
jgi:hypothetical protein